MTGTTIQVTGPKKLLRELYREARREHAHGSPFAGVFDQAVRLKAEDGHHELLLRRFGYLPLNTARHKLAPVLDAIAERKGLSDDRARVHIEARPTGGFWNRPSLLA